MSAEYSTQSTPHPPKLPLFLSPDEIRAYYDIDKHGIDRASIDSKMKLEFLVSCLTDEVLTFIKQNPHTNPAGLVLNVDVLLPVFEPVDESELFLKEGESEDSE